MALEECTRERVPLQWAAAQNSLGAALMTLGGRESGTERLKESVTAYRAAAVPVAVTAYRTAAVPVAVTAYRTAQVPVAVTAVRTKGIPCVFQPRSGTMTSWPV